MILFAIIGLITFLLLKNLNNILIFLVKITGGTPYIPQNNDIGIKLDKILQECKQGGSLADIKKIKDIIEQNAGNINFELLDRSKYKMAEIYQDLKNYNEAIDLYIQIINGDMYILYKTYYEENDEKALKEFSEKSIYIYSQVEEKIAECEEELNKNIQPVINSNIELVSLQQENIEVKTNFNNLDNKKHSSSNKKIKLESCTKNDLLTIDGFDEEKADKFIKNRRDGKYYYDIETFVSDYGLMPHQMIEVQDRLVFPPKPQNKMGRKIDW